MGNAQGASWPRPSDPHTHTSPLLVPSLEHVLSVPAVQLASLSLPRLRRDKGLKSSLLSGWGLEDMGMPYRKSDRTELLEVAGLDDGAAGAGVFPAPWPLGVTVAAVEVLWLTSVLDLASRDRSSAGLSRRRRNQDQDKHKFCLKVQLDLNLKVWCVWKVKNITARHQASCWPTVITCQASPGLGCICCGKRNSNCKWRWTTCLHVSTSI